MTRATVAIAVDPTDGDVPEDMVLCDPLHVTKLVPLGRSKAKTRRSRKKN